MKRRVAIAHRIVAFVVVGSTVVACAGGSDESGPPESAGVTAVSGSEDDELFTQNGAADSVAADESPEPVVESIPPVAETGVPGIDSDDAFCRGWSVYAGSVQALSLAWAVQPADAASVLEVAANDAVADAVAAMASELPAEIEANRDALTIDVPGPFLRRAERARQALVEEGVSDAEIEQLGDAWIDALASAGLDAEDVSVQLSAELEPRVEVAAASFRDSVPSILEDPTLDTTEFDITPSLDYIFENCPDRGTLAGNDIVESGS
jgi:hypothetical protein